MIRIVKAFAALLAAFVAVSCAPRQPTTGPATPKPVSSVLSALDRAVTAIRAQDWAIAETHLETGLRHAPGHPLFIEQLMRVRARVGDTAGVIDALRQLSGIGSVRPVSGDTLYAFMRPNDELERLGAELEGRSAPVVRSDTVSVVAGPDLLVESIARHAGYPDTFFLGSMRTGDILAAADRGATVRTLANAGGRVLGIKVDKRGRLWANVWMPGTPATGAAQPLARSELLVIDVSSGRVLKRFASPADGMPHQFNDVAFGSRGEAYITDTEAGRVYRVTDRDRDLTTFENPSTEFTGPNGVAVSPDGKRIYVAHVEGISVWKGGRGGRQLMRSVPGVPLTGVDGLYACNGALIAVQSAGGIDRITWLALDPDGLRVSGGTVLEQRHPAARQPTTGVISGDRVYYVATSDVRRHRPDGSVQPTDGPRNTVILGLTLPGMCE